ncbi:intermembrane transport protein PqiB [Cerasicoccus fimbriatus]|uniref:PqiB family protein n=1 Tax=Cerasicoccus fimbriatus TaxID=3014554 RepID=UPI0022B4E05C|nr:MlaD family protein [Cerasicoccus sp. TK19100]
MDKKDKDSLPDVVITEHHRFSIVWIVPIAALLIAGWLAYHSYASRGPEIEITFTDGSGLVAGKTEIQYLGVKVGLVEKVRLDEKLSKVVVKARLDKSAAGLATEGAAFWVVSPQIGIGGVRGLDTLISGNYIGVAPGKGGQLVKEYVGLPEQPPAGPREPGLNIILQAEKLGSLTTGDPVYYREFQIGEVDQVYLASDSRTVHAHVHIKEEYTPLIRENTRFWNASGIGMSLGLFGAKVQTESLAAILKGGVSLATPPNDEMGAAVSDNTVFKLYDEPEDEWTKWSPDIQISEKISSLAKASGAADLTPANADTVAQPAGTEAVKDENQPEVKMPVSPPGHHR